MNIFSRTVIKELLLKHNTKLSKSLGQNFLIDKNVLKKLIKASDLKQSDLVLEIGPGIGTITQELARHVKKVITIEKDRNIISILKKTTRLDKNIEIVNKDALKANLKLPKNYKVVANLPYYITGNILRKLLESKNPPQEIVIMIQKEVAQRICAKPPNTNLLATSVQFFADPKIITYVSKKSFYPVPKVDSAIIKITPRKENISEKFQKKFFKIVKAGFSHPRKQIINNLSKELNLNKEKTQAWLNKNNVQPSQRAETLDIDDWKNLTRSSKI